MKTIDQDELIEYIKRYGRNTTKKMIGKVIYCKYKEYTTEELIFYGFKKTIITKVKQHIKKGKDLHHINKTNGNIKKEYRGVHIYNEIFEMFAQEKTNKNKLERIYEMLCEKMKIKFEGIEMKIDPITCEEIKTPCYIRQDWKTNSKIIMDKETILGCRKWKDVIVGYDVIDERTVYFTRRYLEDGFISPYTRNSFEYEDIMYVPRYIQELQ